jgi:hypothetical protein
VKTPSEWALPELVNHDGGGKATEAGSNMKSDLILCMLMLVSPLALANCRKRRRGSVHLELTMKYHVLIFRLIMVSLVWLWN